MYKVFFNERLICINSDKDRKENIKIEQKEDLRSLLFNFFEKENNLFLFSQNPSLVFSWLQKEFNYIEAAGGIVENGDEELLFIYRLGFWDLPKGKIELDEPPEDAAYREIKEECGIKSHQLQKHLVNTFHIYSMHGQMYLKKTFWYYFLIQDSSEETTPQTEENIERVVWLSEEEIQLALLESYESIKEVYHSYNAL
jgi:ADP-ribose pyrophosphatase YjhB (NUDIX family)